MKKNLLGLICLVFLSLPVMSQDIIYTISGELNNQKVSLDSIMMENLTNNTWMTFKDLPDEQYYQINLTKKAFWGTVGVNDFGIGAGFIEVQNLPGTIVLSYKRNTPERFNLSIFNIVGQKIYSESNKLIYPGNSIMVQPGAAGVYLVRIETSNEAQSFKVTGFDIEKPNKVEVIDGKSINPTTKSAILSAEDNFAFNIGDSIRVSVFKNGYFSFPEKHKAITKGQMNFQLESSMALVDGISDAYFPLDEIYTDIESFNKESGVLQLEYSGQIPGIREGNIITVDLDTTGYLRKVTKVTETGGKLIVETQQASINELFVEKNIKINTELITPDNILKSSSNEKISEALTDKNGYIHPVEIIYQLDDGSKQIISAFTKSGQAGDVFELFRFDEDFRMDLLGTNEDDEHLYIKEGNVSLVGNALFEFDFQYKDNLAPDTKIKEGDLEMFSYFLKLNYNSIMNLALDTKNNVKKSGVKKVWDNPKLVAKFLIGAVPLWITFDHDFYASYLMEAELSANVQWGFTNTIKRTVGGSYHQESGSFVPFIDNKLPILDFFPLELTDKFNVKTTFELYPRIDALFYGFAGPFVELVPNLKANLDTKLQVQLTSAGQENFIAWNSNIDAGLDLRSGFSLSFLDKKKRDFTPLDVNLYNKRLWEAPDSMSLESEIPGISKVGDKIELKYQVFDNLKNPLAGCPVVFKDDEGFSKIIFSDLTGIANLEYLVPEDTKKDNKVIITSTLYNSEKSTIEELVNEVNYGSLKQLLIENSPWLFIDEEEYKERWTFKDGGIIERYWSYEDSDTPFEEGTDIGTWGQTSENVIWIKIKDNDDNGFEDELSDMQIIAINEKAMTVIFWFDKGTSEEDWEQYELISTKNK